MKLLLADPILTPLIVGGLTAAGLGGGLTVGGLAIGATAIAHVLSFVIVAGISVGLYLLTAPPIPKPEDGKLPVQETVAPRQYCYGAARLSGPMMLRETNRRVASGGSSGGGGGGNLCTVVALTSHEIDSFRNIYLNDNKCQFSGAPIPDPTFPGGHHVDVQADGRYGADRVHITTRKGVVPETYMPMFTGVSLDSALWPSTSRGDGIASLGMLCSDGSPDASTPDSQSRRYPYGAPNPSAVIHGYRVYDQRFPAQILDPATAAGGLPTAAETATWAWSNNPVLCIMHFLCFSEFGFRYPYDLAIAPVIADWNHQVNICEDRFDTIADGPLSINRYELGGFANTDNAQKEVLRIMLAACDGWLVRRGDSSCLIRVGKFEASGVVLTDDDIIGFSYQNGLSDEDVINRLDMQLTSQDHAYTQVECDPFNDSPDQISRGHVRESLMDLAWVQDYRIARRLGKREFYRLREPLRGSLDLKLSAINAAYERWIYVQSDLIPALSNRYIENRLCRFSLTGTPSIHMEFIGIDPTKLEAWATSNEGKAPPPLYDTSL
jgi:hypothetical protein